MTNVPCDFGAWLACQLRTGKFGDHALVSCPRGVPKLDPNKIKALFRDFSGGYDTNYYGLIAVGDRRYKITTSLCKYRDDCTGVSFNMKDEMFSDRDDLTPADGPLVQCLFEREFGDVVCTTVLHHPKKGLGVAWREMPRFFGPDWTKNDDNGIDGHILGEGHQGYVRLRKTPSVLNHVGWKVVLRANRGCTSFLGLQLRPIADLR